MVQGKAGGSLLPPAKVGGGGDSIYPMMHRFILHYQTSERT